MMSSVYNLKERICPVCSSKDISVFVEISQVPVHCNRLWQTSSKARSVTKGDIKLGFCSDCNHIFNLVFKPELMAYDQSYENSLHFSSHFQSYAKSLATNLIKRHDLHNKDIIEIGCGRGDFLSLICELGNNRGVGFDISTGPEVSDKLSAKNIKFVRDSYSNRYAHYNADLICSRHVLEHIHNPIDFLTQLRQTIGSRPNIAVFIEVPNVLFILRDLSIWDIIYEHCSYYSIYSLECLFKECGFKVCDIYETYEGQFLCVETLAIDRPEEFEQKRKDGLNKGITRQVATFQEKYSSKINDYKRKLERYVDEGRRIVIWGAGSKGVTFLNTLVLNSQIEYVVDINPNKQGMYIPGTGQQIVSPEFLQNYKPDVVIIMNSIYENEIKQLTKKFGITPEFICP